MKTCSTACQPRKATTHKFMPRWDILETESEWLIRTDLPGVSLNEIELNFHDSELTLTGKVPAVEPNRKWLCREYEIGDFERKVRLPQEVDGEKIAADFKNGVLSVHLPKIQKNSKGRIAISESVE